MTFFPSEADNLFGSNDVEEELREVNEDYISGRMNAFGKSEAQEEFQQELRNINELQMKMLQATNSLVCLSASDDKKLHVVVTEVVQNNINANEDENKKKENFSSGGENSPSSILRYAGDNGKTNSKKESTINEPPASSTFTVLEMHDCVFEVLGNHFHVLENSLDQMNSIMQQTHLRVSTLNNFLHKDHHNNDNNVQMN